MIFRKILIFLLLIHVIGDFYVQFPEMAEKKRDNIWWVCIHGAVYCGSAFVLIIPVLSGERMRIWIAVSVSHLLIDFVKYVYLQVLVRKPAVAALHDSSIFCIDQCLHIFCLIAIACASVSSTGSIHINRWIAGVFEITGISAGVIASWITALAVLHKPANILISKILSNYKPKDKDKGRLHDNNAGRFIGTLERIIILIFIAAGQYGAIGLVLTAKSIARYDKIVKDPTFAEYYLLGTLLSTAVAVVTALLLVS